MLQLKKFPDIPVSTREKHKSPAHIQKSPVSASSLERRDPFPAWSGMNSRTCHSSSRGGALHRKGERNSRVVPPFPESPRFLSPLQGKTLFPALPPLSRRGSTHTTVARGTALWKALWESLVGMPRGKATDPLIHAKGRVTLLLQLGRKAHMHAPTRDED